ncbi:MAG: molybdenum cofactor biosynthesis protein [Acidobacteria bacterium]|nr:molybdenum cofactor biosynthesis protein [Acidobacteriota bacterium]
MRPFASTIPLDEARRRLEAAVRPVARTEAVALEEAAGRVVAHEVTSPLDVPPFARAAMDGYAVVAADTAGASASSPVRLHVTDRLYTGVPPRIAIVPGTCAEIATGAPMPEGADAVVMVEDTLDAGADRVAIHTAAAPGQHIGRRAADIAAGEMVVGAGELLTPGRIGALAAVGCARGEVFARPRVAILSTGDEIVEPGRPLPPGRIFDVNRFTLAALVAANGGLPEPRPPVRDAVGALAGAFDACADADLMVFSGGSSVGDRDLIADAIAGRGDVIFHGVAIKPGKPMMFARVGGTPFFGMPGNPSSCLSNAYVLLQPFLRAMARLPPLAPRTLRVPLGRTITSQAGRHQFYTVRLLDGTAMPAFKGSGDITSLSRADGYLEIGADTIRLEAGTLVDVMLF